MNPDITQCMQILESYDKEILIDSVEGEGTSLKIVLPEDKANSME